ncbi:hypothetical protein [Actinophytocola sp. NPDC049390]|uniref:hypothetical protein n=1 Tax=Actinophytocola sp. NPDC049390 TaxID=3363894 RepID=UPI00379B9164
MLDGDSGLAAAAAAVDQGDLGHYSAVSLATEVLADAYGLEGDDALALLRAHAFSTGQALNEVGTAVLRAEINLNPAADAATGRDDDNYGHAD